MSTVVAPQNYYNEVTYEAIYQKPLFQNALSISRAFIVCLSLMALVWFEPWAIHVASIPMVIGISWLKAILMVEAFGNIYHRFFQHLGLWKNAPRWITKVRRTHQHHHFQHYPAGPRYVYPSGVYVAAEENEIFSSWTVPGILFAILYIVSHGLNFASVMFVVGVGLYARFAVDAAHSWFHCHWWDEKPKGLLQRYLQRLNKEHFLHHVYQWGNYHILWRGMSQLAGDYICPEKHAWVFAVAKDKSKGLTEFDYANLVYMLEESSPAAKTAFVIQAGKHRMQNLLKEFVLVSRKRKEEDPKEANKYQHWIDLAIELLTTLKTPESEKILAELAV